MAFERIHQDLIEIDFRIIDLLAEREKAIKKMILFQKKHNITTIHSERNKQMLVKYWKRAIDKNLNPELIRQIFDIIITDMPRFVENYELASESKNDYNSDYFSNENSQSNKEVNRND